MLQVGDMLGGVPGSVVLVGEGGENVVIIDAERVLSISWLIRGVDERCVG